jgi:hypothetical protein
MASPAGPFAPSCWKIISDVYGNILYQMFASQGKYNSAAEAEKAITLASIFTLERMIK